MEKTDLSYMGPMIKRARLAENMTQEELAEKVEKTSRYIQAIENESRNVSIDTLFRLVRALHISADTIIYPEQGISNTETEQLIHYIRLLSDRDRKVILATVKQMVDNT